LVRIVDDAAGNVFYSRTYGFSTRSIAPHQWDSTNFQVAAGTQPGHSRLYVVANGIASHGMAILVANRCEGNDDRGGHRGADNQGGHRGADNQGDN
jgi:hypothetical protein